MKFSLIALHLALVVQFQKTPHFIQRKVTLDNGDVVNVNSGCSNSISVASVGEGEKKKFVVNIVVSTGPGLYKPASLEFNDTKEADRITAAVKAGLDAASNDDTVSSPVVIVPPADA